MAVQQIPQPPPPVLSVAMSDSATVADSNEAIKTEAQGGVSSLTTNKKWVGFELSSNMHMYYAFDKHIYSFSSMSAYIFPVWQAYFFFLIYASTFEIVHTCVSVKNTKGHKVLSDRNKYFTFVNHTCYFTSMTLKYSLFVSHIFFSNANEAFTAIHIYFTFGSHICSLTFNWMYYNITLW